MADKFLTKEEEEAKKKLESGSGDEFEQDTAKRRAFKSIRDAFKRKEAFNGISTSTST